MQFTEPEDTIYDPFSGAGTVALEAWIAGRHVFVGDLSPYAYVLSKSKMNSPKNLEDAERRLDIYWQEATDERRMIDLRKIPRWVRKFFHPETLRDAIAIRNVMLRHHQYLLLMRVESGDDPKPAIWEESRSIITESGEELSDFEFIERAAFYERAEKAYAVVATSEKTLYANIILKKGVI